MDVDLFVKFFNVFIVFSSTSNKIIAYDVGFPDAKPFHGVYAAWYSVDNCHGRWQRGCCVFGLDDIPLLINRKEFFANKFEISFQPLALECLGQWILHKQFHPPRLDLTYYQNLPFVKQQLKFV